MSLSKDKIVFIVGPTAIGKTSLAVKLASKIKGEIISCDSMQVYRGIKILSQAPALRETGKVPYHLINFLSPAKEFSVARFIKMGRRLIREIIARKRTPIIAGGSGLYIKGLIDGLFPSPEADNKFRKRMYVLAKCQGSRYLHRKLKVIDPISAAAIHENDAKRIIRALEIWHSTGKTMTELKKETKGIGGIYNIKMFGLTAPRDIIYERINGRVDDMIRAGAVKEAKKISKKKLSKTAGTILGLRELSDFLGGEYDLNTAIELMKRNTRRFAKRQLTWFRADKRIRWFDVSQMSEAAIAKAIIKKIRS